MKTIVNVEELLAVRIDEADGSLQIYFKGREAVFLIDKEDDNYEAYLAKLLPIKAGQL